MGISNLRSPERFYIPGSEHPDEFRGQCMRCGVCTIRCPTFEILRDEKDGPRGRVALAIEVLESDGPPRAEAVKHLDRCLSCLACSNTCPFGVDHTHLWDQAKAKIERTFKRPLLTRILRETLAFTLPYAWRFRLSMKAASLGRLFSFVLPSSFKRLVEMAPRQLPKHEGAHTGTFAAIGRKSMRVAVLAGCAQDVLRPSIHESAIRFLTKHGCEVVVPPEVGCCGALVLHMGRPESARQFAMRAIEAWERMIELGGLDAIIVTASGCGTALKGYGDLFENDANWKRRADRIAKLSKDISEVASKLDLKPTRDVSELRTVYHNPCSLENGQNIRIAPEQLLRRLGLQLLKPPRSPSCCGSAGTYNLLEPEIASELGKRKASALTAVRPDVVVTANIGCLTQIGLYTATPLIHTVELLDWVTGGPRPVGLNQEICP
ncbi:MAG: glycolate oxidase subunit GlcF [Pseudomonadota bacterium]